MEPNRPEGSEQSGEGPMDASTGRLDRPFTVPRKQPHHEALRLQTGLQTLPAVHGRPVLRVNDSGVYSPGASTAFR